MRAYLIDASALTDFVLEPREAKSQRVRQAVMKLAALQSQWKAALFVPGICLAECAKAMARIAYADGWSERADDAYARRIDLLMEFSSAGRSATFRSLELEQDFLESVEDVFRLEYRMPVRHRTSRLSGVDAVVIAIGRELARRYGDDRVVIVTAERWMAEVCGRNRGRLPAAVYAAERPVPDA